MQVDFILKSYLTYIYLCDNKKNYKKKNNFPETKHFLIQSLFLYLFYSSDVCVYLHTERGSEI